MFILWHCARGASVFAFPFLSSAKKKPTRLAVWKTVRIPLKIHLKSSRDFVGARSATSGRCWMKGLGRASIRAGWYGCNFGSGHLTTSDLFSGGDCVRVDRWATPNHPRHHLLASFN